MSADSRVPQLRRFRRRTVRLRVELHSAGGVREEWATTLGAGGLFLETEDPLRTGARIKLRFRLPGGVVLHELEARVAWVMASDAASGSPAPSAGMGVEFIDAAATAVLARELEREPELGGG